MVDKNMHLMVSIKKDENNKERIQSITMQGFNVEKRKGYIYDNVKFRQNINNDIVSLSEKELISNFYQFLLNFIKKDYKLHIWGLTNDDINTVIQILKKYNIYMSNKNVNVYHKDTIISLIINNINISYKDYSDKLYDIIKDDLINKNITNNEILIGVYQAILTYYIYKNLIITNVELANKDIKNYYKISNISTGDEILILNPTVKDFYDIVNVEHEECYDILREEFFNNLNFVIEKKFNNSPYEKIVSLQLEYLVDNDDSYYHLLYLTPIEIEYLIIDILSYNLFDEVDYNITSIIDEKFE